MRSRCLGLSRVRWFALMILGAAVLPAAASPTAEPPNITWDAESGRALLANGRLQLVVETKDGINAKSLRDTKSGQVFADRDYQWPGGGFPKLEKAPEITKLDDGSSSISFKGRLGAIDVEQTFTLPKSEPGVLVEQITIRNPTDRPAVTKDFKCGFTKCLREGETWTVDAGEIRLNPVPYCREIDGRMQDFPLREVAEHGGTFAGYLDPPQQTPNWGAEGWVWSSEGSGVRGQGSGATNAQKSESPNLQASKSPNSPGPHPSPLPKGEGTASFLLAKYNQHDMEWSLLEPVKRGTETLLRFGGAGQWKHGHPAGSSQLAPGRSYRFGRSRMQTLAGDWKQAFYAYRGFIERNVGRMSETYNPPVHWNELYDNEYFARMSPLIRQYLKPNGVSVKLSFWEKDKELLKQHYTLDMMLAEAAKAKDLGCEALYLDPGWDVRMNHHVWDASRLGSMDSFVARMQNEYGLKVSVWCNLGNAPPMCGDYEACPVEAQCVDKDGNRTELFCFSSPAFLETKEKRMSELCRQGVAFMMFDSAHYYGPCYDKTHGHSIPLTWDDHAKGVLELIRRVKRKYPNVLIEMHDPCGFHYTPAYYGYGRPDSQDCLWGHEFMWMTKDDLFSGRAISLYYYNLAYSIPIYLHISIKDEDENAVLFWWFASTCRHLGMGGKPGPVAWDACKKAMRTYLPLKKFYTQGEFYGIEETAHAHTLPKLRESVINVFNLDAKPVEKDVRFLPADIGLPSGSVKIEGAPFTVKGDEITLKMSIPARGHGLVKVKAR
jgi:hypothetical protein